MELQEAASYPLWLLQIRLRPCAGAVVLVTAKPSPTLFLLNTVFHGHISLKSVLLLPSAGIAGVRHHTPDSVYVCRLAAAACDVDLLIHMCQRTA